MAEINQITRAGFDPVNVSAKGDQFFVKAEGVDLIVIYSANSSIHSIDTFASEATLASLPTETIESDFLNIDFSRAKLSKQHMNEALFFLAELDTSEFVGQSIVTGCPLEDLDQEILLDLTTKNFIISEE